MQHVDNLRNLGRQRLLELWSELPGNRTPPARAEHLVRELAYRLQERQFGGLDKSSRVSMRRHMNTFESSLNGQKNTVKFTPLSRVTLEAGSTISREWNHQTVRVNVIGPRCFEYDGKQYRSLSAIAREITGQHLSGPLFFGLKEAHHG